MFGFRIFPSWISIARRMVGGRRSSLGPGEYGSQVGKQRLADLPGGGIPQVGRAVVDGVVRDVGADGEGRVVERGGPRPTEGHRLIAGHIDDHAARLERREIVLDQECQWRIGVLKDAVDDDIVLGEKLRQGSPPAVDEGVALRSAARARRLLVELHDVGGVDRRGHRGDTAVGEDVDVRDAVRAQCRHRTPPRGRAETDHRGTQPTAIGARGADELKRVQHRAVAGHLVVLVKDMQGERPVGAPVLHGLERDERLAVFDGTLSQRRVLHAVRPAPQDLPAPPKFVEIVGVRLDQQDDVALGDQLGA